MKNQICSFVGCHVGANVQAIYVTRATLKVEDGTGSAILVCDNSRHVQSILHISADEWKADIEKEAMCQSFLGFFTAATKRSGFKANK